MKIFGKIVLFLIVEFALTWWAFYTCNKFGDHKTDINDSLDMTITVFWFTFNLVCALAPIAYIFGILLYFKSDSKNEN